MAVFFRKTPLLLIALVLLARCSGPAAVEPPPAPVVEAPPPEPTGPAYAAIYFDAGGLNWHDARTEETTALRPGTAYRAPALPSPDGRRLAVRYTDGDSARLAILDLETGALRDVHAASGATVYSTAWAADGVELAFGYYREVRRGDGTTSMGEGDIRIAAADGTTRRVGCRASKMVMHWHPGGDLVVRNDNNLFVVSPEDCSDLAPAIDARRMHHITFSPDGARMAYIHRQFVMRNRRPSADSTLYLADYRGQDAQVVAAPRYHAHNPTFSPDGTLLAYDAASQDHPGVRQLYVYDVAADKRSFLTPPDESGATSESHPRWSPNGNNFAFDRRYVDGGTRQQVARIFGGFAVVAEGPETIWGWLGNDALVLAAPDRAVRVVKIEAQAAHALPNAEALLHIHVGGAP